MKIGIFFKRFLCLLLISSTLLITCACAAEDDSLGSDSSFGSDLTETNATLKPFDSKTMVLSGTPSFRIVYSSDYRAQALKIQDKMISLDKSYTIGSGKYSLVLDTKTAADGTPEIIVGNTNRTASKEAKKLVNGKTDYYSIYVTDNAIAVYAASKDGVDVGVSALVKKLSSKDGAVIYNNANGNITSKFEKPQVKPSDQTQTIEKTDIDTSALLNALKNAAGSKAYSIAVAGTDGIKIASIRNTNAQNTYSVSKVFCVTAIGMLYDEGKLNPMRDTIGSIFKEEIKAYGIDANKWSKVTVHDVLRHRAGFTAGGLLDIDADPSLMNKHDDFLKVVLNYNLSTYERDKTIENFGNIANRKYTDAAYYLISRVVAKKSGQKLDVYLKSRLFDVAGYKDYRIVKCPEGYPIGATQFFLRPDDVVKLGRIYLDGGTYNGKRIISQDWVNKVIQNGYELKSSNNGYGKGGMRGQYLYINFDEKVVVAWHSYDPEDLNGPLHDTLHDFLG
jgi:hypothetical protein